MYLEFDVTAHGAGETRPLNGQYYVVMLISNIEEWLHHAPPLPDTAQELVIGCKHLQLNVE